jgi:mannose-6-phosphate isomerase-like protein (cupin superfamily)
MTATTLMPALGRKTLRNTLRYAEGTGTILIDGSETGGAFALFEAVQRPGSEPALHLHEREDETFFILEGKASIWVGGIVHHLQAGDSIFLPRNVPHTFRIKSAVVRALNYISPAGFEEWFRKWGTPATSFDLPEQVVPPTEAEIAAMIEYAPKLGVRLLGPAPEF